MCGIAGQLRFPAPDPNRVQQMTEALAHRGPDGAALYEDGPVALGHRRLSVIDLAGGTQPLFNEDHSIAVIQNGEIYNYRELAQSLKGRHTFKTASDTEVLVHLYEEHGEDLVHPLRGMFSFALWDARARKLVCARDRYGEKPFLYVTEEAGLTFASEMRAFTAAGVDVGALDRAGLADYLERLYIPAPRSIYAKVKKLPAGHLLVADERGVRVRRYWEPPVPGSRPDAVADPAELRRRLEDAVRVQLRSDVPVAALLSGGVDSSTITALMARELGRPVRTFSVGFGNENDELPFAREVATRYGTEHHELLVTDGVLEQTALGMAAYSEPFGDSSAVPTVAVCREVAKHAKVVLTGDGGDELFAGYGTYRRLAALPRVPGLASLSPGRTLGRAARVVGAAGGARHRALVEVFNADERRALLGTPSEPVPVWDMGRDVDDAIAFDLRTYLPEDLLVKVDIASMHSSLESRAPFLDPAVGAYAIPFSSEKKQSRMEGKLLLKAAVQDLLPQSVLTRAKRGFGSPVEGWLQGPLRALLHDLVGAPNARVRGLLDGAAVDAVLAGVRGGGNAHQAWALLAFESWAQGLSG